MNKLQVYGDRLFEAPKDGEKSEPEKKVGEPEIKGLDTDIKAKLERLDYLEFENKDLKTQREKVNKVKRDEEEEKLKQKGEYEKLLSSKEDELKGLKTKADAFDELRSMEIEEAKKILGKLWLDEYENLSLSALRKTVQMLDQRLKKIPGTDNGGSSEPPVVQLSAQQKRDAHEKFAHLSPEKAEEAWYEVLVKSGKIKKGN